MKVINFYGAPCAGKSTLACELFAYMKKNGYKVEIASEYAKDCVYEEKYLTLQDQVYLIGKMNHKLQMYKNANLDFVICDSPLLLNMFYKRHHYKMNYLDDKIFDDFCIGLNNIYDRINIFLTTDKSIKYQKEGRIQTQEESNNYSKQIEQLLIDNNEKYTKVVNSIDLNIEQIFAIIQREM
jgi:tRNA uridine 5-carbamoylmethylation protein Kti12